MLLRAMDTVGGIMDNGGGFNVTQTYLSTHLNITIIEIKQYEPNKS